MADIGEWLKQHWNEAEHAVTEDVGGWFHRDTGGDPYASAAPAAATSTITADTQEDPMNVLAELEADAKALAAKFETVDKDALARLEDIQAHPAALDAFNALAALVHSPFDATEGLGVVVSVLKMTLSALNGQAQAAANVPAEPQYAAGPQVAGQA